MFGMIIKEKGKFLEYSNVPKKKLAYLMFGKIVKEKGKFL